ncbi:MAG: class I SAM-dependent methyltransferase [Candidatus Marinimicrobia bacterium]|nr:class I SAM-dependent methyltransferase [Candidatus Neomarinimicrobiota bacterium]
MREEIRSWLENKGLEFLKKIGIKSGQTVLDFGCGKGNYTLPAAKIVEKEGIVYALDKNSETLVQLGERAKKEGLTNIKRINTSGKIDTGLRNDSIDAVLLYDIIHLVGKDDSSTLKDRKKLYKEAHRLIKPSGMLSVYPTHLKTHTDVGSVEEIRREIIDFSFEFEKEFLEILVHDDIFIEGKILNFRKKTK